MKTALVTMALTPDHEIMGEALTFPAMRDYAKRYGMDFVVINKCKRDLRLGDVYDWERNDALYQLLGDYQKILHIEDDVIVRPDAVDISSLPFNVFYGFDNAPFNMPEVFRCQNQANRTWPDLIAKHPMKHLFNNGMFVCDSSHRHLFSPIQPEPYNVNSNPDAESHWKAMGLIAQRMHFYNVESEHRPDLFGFSYMNPQPTPSFVHVLWSDKPKYEAVRDYKAQIR